MKPASFSYARPDTIGELLELLAQEGDRARVLAGGQTLGPMLNMRLVRPQILVDINRTQGLAGVELSADVVRVGAMLRQETALRDPKICQEAPLVPSALVHVGHYQTRSRGTVGGSVAHADPSAELPLVLRVLGGSVELESRRRKRVVPASDFFVSALQTARRPDEAIVALLLPRRKAHEYAGFAEFAMRAGDYAVVACGCLVTMSGETIENVVVGAGGVADTPVLLDLAALRGRRADEETAAYAADLARQMVDPAGDFHVTSDYRRHMTGTVVSTALRNAFSNWKATRHASR